MVGFVASVVLYTHSNRPISMEILAQLRHQLSLRRRVVVTSRESNARSEQILRAESRMAQEAADIYCGIFGVNIQANQGIIFMAQ